MLAVLHLLGILVANLIKSRQRLEIENLFLRHQLNIAMRRAPHSLRLGNSDRALMVWLTRLWPSLIGLTRVVEPDTILRWHRAGFRAYCRWRSGGRPGRPKIDRELRDLIRQMSKDNPIWGAPRIHGELLKLGFEVAESTVSKYLVKRRGPPSQSWRTFLQPCECHRRDRPVRGPHHQLRVSLCLSCHRPWSKTVAMVRGHPAPDGRMAGAADRAGIPVGHGAVVPDPRQ
jgi:hypothetical protein